MDEKMQQIIEDSEKIRNRNRDLEGELHGLKVENERLKEENETMFATQGVADPQNLGDALKWLHDQGGIGAVYSQYKDVVLGETEDALKVVYSENIEKRLMPEGMEWPRTESGEPVKLGDKLIDDDELEEWREVDTIIFQRTEDGYRIEIENDRGVTQFYHPGERVKRPVPKVPDADGAEVRVGDELFDIETGKTHHVAAIDPIGKRFRSMEQMSDDSAWLDLLRFTHRAPVLAADGKPLREGETVWSVDSDTRYTVEKITDELIPIKCRREMGYTVSLFPSQLTHQRPVLDADGVPIHEGDTVRTVWNFTCYPYVVENASNPLEIAVRAKKYPDQRATFRAKSLTHTKLEIDSWERLEEDARQLDIYLNDTTDDYPHMSCCRDLVRRAKALAGVSE